MIRRVLLKGLAGMVAGDGLRRPVNAPRGQGTPVGVQPGVSNAIVIANKVIVFGTGGGVFVYSGTPGPGNPPIASISNTTTDPYGNATEIGINAYTVVSGVRVAIGLNQTMNGGTLGTLPGVTGQSIANAPFTAAGMFAAATSLISFARAGLTTGQSTSTDVAAVIAGQSQADSGVTRGFWQISAGLTAIGNNGTFEVDDREGIVLLAPQTGPPAAGTASGLWADLAGDVNVRNFIDGNDYRAGHLVQFGNSGQLINSTSPAVITGMSMTMAAGNYHVQGWINFTGTAAAGSAQFGFDGTVTLSHADGGAFFSTPGVGLGNASVFSGSLALAGSPTLTGGLQRWEFDAFVVCSAGGTFNVRAQEGVAGDSFTVNSGYLRAETY